MSSGALCLALCACRSSARRYGSYHWRVSPKPKVQVAREHLTKAQDEAAGGDTRDALQWGFASLEARVLRRGRPDLGEISVEDVLSDIEDAVLAAEAEAA